MINTCFLFFFIYAMIKNRWVIDMDLRDIKEFLKDAFKYIVTAIVVIFIFLYVVTIQQVIGPSMSPTLSNKDIVVLNKMHYRFFKVKIFDIVALEYEDTKYLIKRVIGLPGEKVEYKNNELYVNNKILKEEFLKEGIKTDDFSIKDLHVESIPKDMYLVLGDNRENSMDSREIGFVLKKDILGKVIVKFWPITEFKLVR